MITGANRVTELIAICVQHATTQQYCWFRMSFAKIGEVTPSWVCWFEGMGSQYQIDHTRGAPSLLEALELLVKTI